MLKSASVRLRPIQESDLDELYEHHLDLPSRGDFFPHGILSQSAFRKHFQETGFWEREEGTLLIINDGDKIIGHIEFFKTVAYLDEHELSYQVYDPAQRGKGVATEAVNLMARYLFDTKPINRIRLIIHPDNRASRRVAEKCGFKHEGTARGAWFHQGKHHDVEVYALLRRDDQRE